MVEASGAFFRFVRPSEAGGQSSMDVSSRRNPGGIFWFGVDMGTREFLRPVRSSGIGVSFLWALFCPGSRVLRLTLDFHVFSWCVFVGGRLGDRVYP